MKSDKNLKDGIEPKKKFAKFSKLKSKIAKVSKFCTFNGEHLRVKF